MTLARNALHHFAGGVLPALAALATVPVVVAHLGTETYGTLVLVLSLVGYAALLDLNVATGATKFIAEHRAQGRDEAAVAVFACALAVAAVVGVVGGALLAGLAEPLVTQVFRVPADTAPAAVAALRWAGLGFLVSQLQGGLQGAMHALQRFDLAGGAEAVFGTAASLAVVVAVLCGGGLVAIVVARIVVALLHAAFLARRLQGLLPGATSARPRLATLRRLAGFSAFSYLSRIAAVTAAHGDKLVLAALVDLRALALYAVPFTLVLRAFGMAYRVAQVMFPLASALGARQRLDELREVYLRAGRGVTFLNAALGLWLVALAPEWLHHWAGPAFGRPAVAVMVLLVLAAVADALTQLPSLVNDGLGHPRNTGIAAVLRAVAGLAAAWWGALAAGITGAAAAQGAVGLAAAALTLWVLHRLTVPATLSQVLRRSWGPSLPLLLALPPLAAVSVQRDVLGLGAFAAVAAALALALTGYGWSLVFTARERRAARAHLVAVWGTRWPWRRRRGEPRIGGGRAAPGVGDGR